MQFVAKQVLLDASKFVRSASASNARWRELSFAAAAVPCPTPPPSNSPEIKKPRKRVSKLERRAMVQAFVNKYRAMNTGKFPTPTETKNEVGGSYYVIKRIIQELEYEWKMKGDILQGKDVSTNDDLTSNSKELQKSHLPLNIDIHTGARTNYSTFNGLETVQMAGTANVGEKTLLHGVESASMVCKKAEVDLKEKITAEDKPKFDHVKLLDDQQQTRVELEDSNIQHIEEELGPELSVAEDRLKLDSMKPLDKQQSLTGTVPMDLLDSSIQHHEAELGPETSIPIEKTPLNDIESALVYNSKYDARDRCLQAAEAKHVLDSHPEKLMGDMNEKVSSQKELKFDGRKPLVEEQQPSEVQKCTRELPNEKDSGEHKDKSSVWQNLKTFADGIVSFWRKL